MLTIIAGIAGLVLLYYGAEFLVKGGSSIALKLKISPLVIGLTLVAYATSAPELVVSVDAALKGMGDVSIGNVVGSNIFNVLCILGVAPLISPIHAVGISYVDMFLMLGISILLYPFMKSGMKISRKEGIAFLSIYILYTVYLIFK